MDDSACPRVVTFVMEEQEQSSQLDHYLYHCQRTDGDSEDSSESESGPSLKKVSTGLEQPGVVLVTSGALVREETRRAEAQEEVFEEEEAPGVTVREETTALSDCFGLGDPVFERRRRNLEIRTCDVYPGLPKFSTLSFSAESSIGGRPQCTCRGTRERSRKQQLTTETRSRVPKNVVQTRNQPACGTSPRSSAAWLRRLLTLQVDG